MDILSRTVNEAYEYVQSNYAKTRASMVRNYLATAGAFLAILFTAIQTICALYQYKGKGKSLYTISLETFGIIDDDDPALLF
ncbi:hypothetical protein PIB30_024321 [Stylosanthes scabra]|uniref:Uncharacterized protein n=1 Tax=Stylosanthes scabra TaxID=79078 RepID=A0ABU6YA95_9FABA|nr:hypothetical protein [Stylosanthes scabra]